MAYHKYAIFRQDEDGPIELACFDTKEEAAMYLLSRTTLPGRYSRYWMSSVGTPTAESN